MIEATIITLYALLVVGTYGMVIYQTVLLRRIAKNTTPLT